MKKIFLVIGITFFVIFIVGGAFMFRFQKMAAHIATEFANVDTIDFSKIPDGIYTGKFGDFLVSVDLEVTVKDKQITNIEVKKQICGKGYEARDVISRIINNQSVKVDAVTGATGSSMAIMIALNQALQVD